jgi:ferredoxin
MILFARSRKRPFHLGSFPLETLPRDDSVAAVEAEAPPRPMPAGSAESVALAGVADRYRSILAQFAEGDVAPGRAPVPDDLERRGADIKGLAYFMDAAQVGICRIPGNAWLEGSEPGAHRFAVVLLIEDGKLPDADNLARGWIEPAVRAVSDMRAAEIAAVVAGHIRHMGFSARAHIAGHEFLDARRLAVLSGLGVRDGEHIVNPYVERFSLAVVATDYELASDRPLHANALKARGLRYWWGINGAQSGRERARRARRPSHYSRYPMETVKRVDRPTTLIIDDEVPRVPKRAAFFERALQGDLGAKAQRERGRFSFKHPTSNSLLQAIRSLVPYQDGEVSEAEADTLNDPVANARAVKALSYFLGSDLTGICEIPRYAWYSHKEDGRPIEMYHRYAVVMLIDQGFDTMEGASGDDWISGTQSMRAYLRGAEIAGVMAEFLRGRGFSSRPQSNADSDVLHIPLVMWAGLGELSRIGELVLNPFVGPRFKSVVLTTDLPMAVDKPVDFGLQYFCNNCLKCARECPCDAIPWGKPVMFNAYEMWKIDAERCTRYRLTNSKGAACGRCMKTCPLNKVVDLDGPLLTRFASWLGINAMWLKPLMVPIATWLDDALGNGKRNPAKKWWFDHEIVDGVAVKPKATNQRDIDPKRYIDPDKQPIAYYNANVMPPPDAPGPEKVDRKAALAAAELLETPAEARERSARGGPPPEFYKPTPPVGVDPEAEGRVASPYKQK